MLVWLLGRWTVSHGGRGQVLVAALVDDCVWGRGGQHVAGGIMLIGQQVVWLLVVVGLLSQELLVVLQGQWLLFVVSIGEVQTFQARVEIVSWQVVSAFH